MKRTYFSFVGVVAAAALSAAFHRHVGIGGLSDDWRREITERALEGDHDVLFGLAADDLAALPARVGARIDSGPLVGAVGPTSARIWMHADRKASIEVIVARGDAPSDAADLRRYRVVADNDNHRAPIVDIGDLTPSTRYRYEVFCEGMRSAEWSGSLTTAPNPGSAGRFTMTFSSCMDGWSDDVQPVWYIAQAQNPAFHLLLGDNAYANSVDPEEQWTAHLRQRRVESFAAMIRNVPTFAVWDDHDFGDNDSDGRNPRKNECLAAFKQLFANPSYGSATTEGTFHAFVWGDVEVFMLDSRFHRSSDDAPNDARKRLLGDGQFEWLKTGLLASKAKWKLIACGSPLVDSSHDSWRGFDFERERLFSLVRDHRVPGVLMLTGDTHFCAVRTHDAQSTFGYPLIEVISSGIGRKEEGHPLRDRSYDHPASPSIEPVPSYRQGFAALEFDTTTQNPTVRIRIHQRGALVPFDRTYRLAELSHR